MTSVLADGIRPNNHISGAADGLVGGVTYVDDIGEQVEATMNEDKVEDVKDQEESRKPKVARVPNKPTKAEYDEHMLLHAEYRSWCPYCLQGKAVSNQHVAGIDSDDKLGVTISMDYTYMNAELDDDNDYGVAHLVMHDNGTNALWCMKVDSKEAKPEIVSWMNQNLLNAGYAGVRLTLKSDGEPAMQALKRALAVKRECETAIVHTPARESKSNCAVERAIRTWKGQMRTMRLHLEDRLKSVIAVDHPILSWLAVWSCEVLNKYKVRDGRTAYELMTGHKVKHTVYAFGQRIWGMFTGDKNAKNDHDSNWIEAYVVGIVPNCGSYRIMSKDMVYQVSTTRAMNDEVSFSPDMLQDVVLEHQDYCRSGASSKRKTTVVFAPVAAVPDSTSRARVPRRAQLRKKDFDRHGLTAGCPGCEWISNPIGNSRNHSEDCRARLERVMMDEGDEQNKLQHAKDRIDEFAANAGAKVDDKQEGKYNDNIEVLVDQPARNSEIVRHTETDGRGSTARSSRDVWADVELDEPVGLELDVSMDMSLDHGGDELEEGQITRSERRFATPERKPAVRRPAGADAGDDNPKVRKLDSDIMDSNDSAGIDIDSIDKVKLDETDKTILGKMLQGSDVLELYSPVRVNAVAAKFGLSPGMSLDLTNGYDFGKLRIRRRHGRLSDEPSHLL